jgi:glutamate/tyrosine decarboxylase-like PLP-dependent enzyme
MSEFNAEREEICILCSQDNHYSMDKAGNVLSLEVAKVPVDFDTRCIDREGVRTVLKKQIESGKKYFIVVANMMTTMFGSVDDPDIYAAELERFGCPYKMHVDGAYGGFYYPFSEENNRLTFDNPNISSFTLDAHKMAQAPYGTGIFLIRKGLMHFAKTKEASYVEGEDFTLIGSRSGANAVAVWMILVKNGPYGWMEKIFILQKRTGWLCEQLAELDIKFYRHPKSNIVTIHSEFISPETAEV